jgi:hypothetical protein
MRKLIPANEWSWNEILLNKIEYALKILAWQNSADATEKHPKHYPDPWLPPFMPKPEKPKKNPEQQAMDIDDIKAFLSRPRESVSLKANE